MLGGDAQPDQRPPVLAEERDLSQIERLDEARHPVDVALIGVVAARGRLVGLAEADEIGCDHAMAGAGAGSDHVPVQVGPGGLAVQHEHGRSGRVALVDVVHAQAVDLDVARLERETVEVLEARVGCFGDVHL